MSAIVDYKQILLVGVGGEVKKLLSEPMLRKYRSLRRNTLCLTLVMVIKFERGFQLLDLSLDLEIIGTPR